MRDKNPIRSLGDYSKPSHEGYRNTIELPEGNDVVPLQSDTIRLVQNGCSFYRLWSEDPNQHLKDFLKLLDSLDLNGSISIWKDLTIRFLSQFFPLGHVRKSTKDEAIFDDISGKPDKSKALVSPKEVDKENEAENETEDNLVKGVKEKLKKIDE
nr:MAK10-like protein [Tanacetum cinerariifolium]